MDGNKMIKYYLYWDMNKDTIVKSTSSDALYPYWKPLIVKEMDRTGWNLDSHVFFYGDKDE